MSHWDLRRCGKQNAAADRMKSGSAAGGDRRSAIAARCRGTDARRSAKHSDEETLAPDTLDDETLATWTDWWIIFMPPSIALGFDGLCCCLTWMSCETFRLAPCAFTRPTRGHLLATRRSQDGVLLTQLSRTHTLMSYTETIFEDLRCRRRLKISTPFSARNRKKPRQHGTFRSRGASERRRPACKTLTQRADSQLCNNRAGTRKRTGANKAAPKKL